ncbi:MAG TPA: GAF domain-containing protein, partial [Herpetosiphonaceae bacterium]|nr:GAF domain-containing protein [Herpetosiphonaceae bacterium]
MKRIGRGDRRLLKDGRARLRPAQPRPADAGRHAAETALRYQNTYLSLLRDTTIDLLRHHDLAWLLERIVTRVGELLETEHGFLYLAAPGGGPMACTVGTGMFGPSVGVQVRPGQGLVGTVWATGAPLMLDDYAAWPGCPPDRPAELAGAIAGAP